MIIWIFRENQIFTTLFTLLLATITWLYVIITKSFIPDFNSIYLSTTFYYLPGLKSINELKILSSGLNVLLVLICGLYLSRIIFKYNILHGRSSLPMFIFFILSIPYFTEYNGFSYPLLTLTILIIVIDMIFASLDKKSNSYRFFDSVFLISTASLLNTYFIFFVVFILLIWIQFRNLRWREFVFIILGTVTPFVILIAILYLNNQEILPVFNAFSELKGIKIVYPFDTKIYYLIGITGFLIIVSSFLVIRNYVKMKILTRKYSLIFLFLFFSVLLIAYFFPLTERDVIFFFAMPIAFLLGYYFSICKVNIFNQILFLALIIGNLLVIIL